jgi:hypothetical protein
MRMLEINNIGNYLCKINMCMHQNYVLYIRKFKQKFRDRKTSFIPIAGALQTAHNARECNVIHVLVVLEVYGEPPSISLFNEVTSFLRCNTLFLPFCLLQHMHASALLRCVSNVTYSLSFLSFHSLIKLYFLLYITA